MAVYLVQAADATQAQILKARFIREGFSWPAFILAQLWLIYHRLWLALAVWVALEVAFVVLVYPHVGVGISAAIDGLAHLFIGLEGNRLRQVKGARATVTELVDARTREEAEAIFYRRFAASAFGPAA